MGFSWAESSKALGTHGSMEEAIESLFSDGGGEALPEAGISRGRGRASIQASSVSDAGSEDSETAAVQEEERDGENGEWVTPRSSRHRAQGTGEPANASRSVPPSSHRPRNALKP